MRELKTVSELDINQQNIHLLVSAVIKNVSRVLLHNVTLLYVIFSSSSLIKGRYSYLQVRIFHVSDILTDFDGCSYWRCIEGISF